MAFQARAQAPSIASINITPLVDVMLVLLVIFMMSAPLLTRAVPLDLPQSAPPTDRPPPQPPIDLRIDVAGAVYWNGQEITLNALTSRMEATVDGATADAQPVLQIDANADSDYGVTAKVLADARSAGMEKIGFVRK